MKPSPRPPALSEHAQAANREQWVRFLKAVHAAALKPEDEADHLKDAAHYAQTRWKTPSLKARQTEVLAALPAMVRAYARQETISARRALAEHLAAWTRVCAGFLDIPLDIPERRVRADLDG